MSWRVGIVSGETARLRITVHPYVLQGVPTALRWAPHAAWLRPRLRSYLASVAGGFAWYVETGTTVPRNHFGAHPWYS